MSWQVFDDTPERKQATACARANDTIGFQVALHHLFDTHPNRVPMSMLMGTCSQVSKEMVRLGIKIVYDRIANGYQGAVDIILMFEALLFSPIFGKGLTKQFKIEMIQWGQKVYHLWNADVASNRENYRFNRSAYCRNSIFLQHWTDEDLKNSPKVFPTP